MTKNQMAKRMNFDGALTSNRDLLEQCLVHMTLPMLCYVKLVNKAFCNSARRVLTSNSWLNALEDVWGSVLNVRAMSRAIQNVNLRFPVTCTIHPNVHKWDDYEMELHWSHPPYKIIVHELKLSIHTTEQNPPASVGCILNKYNPFVGDDEDYAKNTFVSVDRFIVEYPGHGLFHSIEDFKDTLFQNFDYQLPEAYSYRSEFDLLLHPREAFALFSMKPFFLAGDILFGLNTIVDYGWASIFELVLLNRISGL